MYELPTRQSWGFVTSIKICTNLGDVYLKRVSEMHFPLIWLSKFQKLSPWCPNDSANIKETQKKKKNGCRENYLDKRLLI